MSTVFYQCAMCGELLKTCGVADCDDDAVSVHPCTCLNCGPKHTVVPLSRAEVHAYQERFRNGEAK
jgi:hypothetical protein